MSNDLIRRSDVLAAATWDEVKVIWPEDVEKIPAVDPDSFRPKGQWVWCKNHYECSNCNGPRFHDLVLGLDAQYCGRCGADMRGVEEAQETKATRQVDVTPDLELISAVKEQLRQKLAKYFFLHDGCDPMEVLRIVAEGSAVRAIQQASSTDCVAQEDEPRVRKIRITNVRRVRDGSEGWLK